MLIRQKVVEISSCKFPFNTSNLLSFTQKESGASELHLLYFPSKQIKLHSFLEVLIQIHGLFKAMNPS